MAPSRLSSSSLARSISVYHFPPCRSTRATFPIALVRNVPYHHHTSILYLTRRTSSLLRPSFSPYAPVKWHATRFFSWAVVCGAGGELACGRGWADGEDASAAAASSFGGDDHIARRRNKKKQRSGVPRSDYPATRAKGANVVGPVFGCSSGAIGRASIVRGGGGMHL